MASACRRIAQRTNLPTIKSAIKSNVHPNSFSRSVPIPAPTTKSTTSPLRRSFLSRIAPELGCLQSMLPLHSTVAAARMTSCLSTTSRSCRALSQAVNWKDKEGLVVIGKLNTESALGAETHLELGQSVPR